MSHHLFENEAFVCFRDVIPFVQFLTSVTVILTGGSCRQLMCDPIRLHFTGAENLLAERRQREIQMLAAVQKHSEHTCLVLSEFSVQPCAEFAVDAAYAIGDENDVRALNAFLVEQ